MPRTTIYTNLHRPVAHKYNVHCERAHLCISSRGNNATICTSSTNKLCKPKTVQDLTISARKSSMSNRFKALERFLSLRDFINHSYSSCGLGNIIHNFHTKYKESVKGCLGLSEFCKSETFIDLICILNKVFLQRASYKYIFSFAR